MPQAFLFSSAALSPCVCGRVAGTGVGFGPWAGCGGISCPLRAADAGPGAGTWLAAEAETANAGPYAEAAGLEPLLSM